jgi:hypothetical protein
VQAAVSGSQPAEFAGISASGRGGTGGNGVARRVRSIPANPPSEVAVRFAPLAVLLFAAPFSAGFVCNINVIDEDDCPDLEDVCPNLECPDGFAENDDGCAICDCAAPVDDGGTSDGGTITTCSSDFECSDGQFCDTVNFCESACGEARADGQQDCPAVCLGRCVDGQPPVGCSFDGDCADGEICVFDGGGATEPAPACEPDQDCGDDEAGLVAPQGRCVREDPPPTTFCSGDFDCPEGQVCSFDGNSGGAAPCADGETCDMPAPQGQCVDGDEPTDGGSPGQECLSDEDCPDGFCELGSTCAGLDCPPPPPNVCVFNDCDDDSQAVCDMVPPQCAPGFTAAVRNGCFECVDARTCQSSCEQGVDCG